LYREYFLNKYHFKTQMLETYQWEFVLILTNCFLPRINQ